ncbi:MAG TPA: potassium transporter Kup [Hanamia sp.]|nr:potassium transporter Kup [Hanamia sp.]
MEKKSSNSMFKITLAALGIVFGDIGTSPLYALRVCFSGPHGIDPTSDNIFGVLSLIFWSLILVISVKYLVIILNADNEGEGGILALMALVLPKKKTARYLVILTMGLFGAALLYGDGMITPAISVLSAVEGLKVATPLFEPYILPITILILFVLFYFQKKGTGGVGMIFGPVIFIWFLSLALLGINQITRYPKILAALNPYYAVHFFQANGLGSITILGAVFLVVTGGETLYADLGHFGKKPIRKGWFFIVLPSLVLNYFGQGALLLENRNFIQNPFYFLAPHWALYPLVVMAAFATVIASQAVISGAFSLSYQAIQLGFMARFRIVHTSQHEKGQIYIPQLAWILFIATIGLVISFKTSDNLAAAYGVAVSTTMVITTLLAYVAMRNLWRWSITAAGSLVLFFLLIDLSFFSANIVKIPEGGWFPLAVAGIIYYFMTTWHKGKRMMNIQMNRAIDPLEKFLSYYQSKAKAIVDGTAIYLTRNPKGTPPAFFFNLKHNQVIHEKIIILSIQFSQVPHLSVIENAIIKKLDDHVTIILLHYGYMDETDIPQALSMLNKKRVVSIDLQNATYFLGRESIEITRFTGMNPLREMLFDFLGRNSTRLTRYFNLPSEKVFEIGSRIKL